MTQFDSSLCVSLILANCVMYGRAYAMLVEWMNTGQPWGTLSDLDPSAVDVFKTNLQTL